MEERRKFPRLQTTLRVKYWPLASERPVSADTKDIGGGVRLVLGEAVKLGALLAVELTLPRAGAPMTFVGRVAWCAPAAEPGKFEAGLQFVRIDTKDQQAIARFVDASS